MIAGFSCRAVRFLLDSSFQRTTLAALILLLGAAGCGSTSTRVTPQTGQSAPSAGSGKSNETVGPVVFIGDSITALFGQPGFGEAEWSQHGNWINKGIVGQNSNQVLARFQTDVVDLKPAVTVILVGTNDVYPAWTLGPSEVPAVFDNYIDSPGNVEKMVQLAQDAGIKVVLGTIPPWNCGNQNVCALATTADGSQSRYWRIQLWNTWLREYSSRNRLSVAEYWTALVAKNGEQYRTSMTFDGVHPSAAGYAQMAPQVELAIQRAVNTP
jgi:lysophospholipase L1-like esterase